MMGETDVMTTTEKPTSQTDSGVVLCHECGMTREVATVEEAQRLATLHIRFTSCLFCFGYDKMELAKALEHD